MAAGTTNGTAMRILLADRQTLVRNALAAFMAAAGLPAVTETATLADVVGHVKDHKIDLALLDGSVVGVEDLAVIQAAAPQTKLAMMTGFVGREQVDTALKAGAAGVISKVMTGEEFVTAVKDLLAGKQVVPAMVPAAAGGAYGTPYALTRRELDVLRGLFAGKSNKEIGRDLELQEVTVKLHVKTLSRKLNAKNRTHATMIARNEGLV
jgi:two-component system, NarL family, nitrate/nitrite response regulator NarL